MRRLISGFSSLLVIALLFMLIVLYILPLFGADIISVQNKDMEPEIAVGDVVYVRMVALYELELGDLVAYTAADSGDCLAKVHAINRQTQIITVVTQAAPKSFIETPYSTIVGRKVFTLSGAADWVDYMNTATGKLIAGCAMVAVFGMRLILSDKKVKGAFRT